jgi:hypothetical protein
LYITVMAGLQTIEPASAWRDPVPREKTLRLYCTILILTDLDCQSIAQTIETSLRLQ